MYISITKNWERCKSEQEKRDYLCSKLTELNEFTIFKKGKKKGKKKKSFLIIFILSPKKNTSMMIDKRFSYWSCVYGKKEKKKYNMCNLFFLILKNKFTFLYVFKLIATIFVDTILKSLFCTGVTFGVHDK